MILQALCELAETEGLVSNPDFQNKPIAWLVRVGDGGKLIGISGTHYQPPQPEGSKKKPKPVVKQMRIPRQPGRSGTKAPAAFFVDNAKYVFGLATKDKPFDEEEGRTKSEMFLEQVQKCVTETMDPGAQAVLEFLWRIHQDRSQITLPDNCISNDQFAFIYAPDIDMLVHERNAIAAYWHELRNRRDQENPIAQSSQERMCLVTGDMAVPARLFPLIKKVPGGSTNGVGLVSFNKPAFESYGWDNNENAPISEQASVAAGEALNRLVDPTFPNPENPNIALPSRRVSLSDDTIVCYWASGKNQFVDSFGDIVDVDPAAVPALYQSIWKGQPPEQPEPGSFYAMTLTGTQGRLILRDWFESTVETVAHNISRHFRDLDVMRNTPPTKGKELPPAISLGVLLSSLAVLGKRENIPKPLASHFFRAIIAGQPYPLSLLQKALERARSEASRDEYLDMMRRDARAAIIKAVLIRHYEMEITPDMDPNNTEPGYLLGRLMAVLENLQLKAHDYKINATIVDRYFGAASATPAVVFPRLLKGARYNAAKAKDEDSSKGAAINLEKDIDAILAKMPTRFPVWLNLQQQGLFVLGYHQQRGLRRAPKDDKQQVSEQSVDL